MRSTLFLAAALAITAVSAGAQQTPVTDPRLSQTTLTPNRDVVLEIPELSIDSLGLTVSNVRAHVSLLANAMNFVTISAGVDVAIKQVQLGLSGVFAEAYLYVDLDNVARIVARVVQTLDKNPQILTQILKTVETAATSIAGPPPRQ